MLISLLGGSSVRDMSGVAGVNGGGIGGGTFTDSVSSSDRHCMLCVVLCGGTNSLQRLMFTLALSGRLRL